MEKVLKIFAVVSLCITALIGCSSTPTLSDNEMRQQYPLVIELGDRLDAARDAGLNVLAPQKFEEASSSYERARNLARISDDRYDRVARQGITSLNEAERIAANTQDVFEEVFNARAMALKAGANTFDSRGFTAAEERLNNLARMMESGQVERAKAGREDLITRYRDLELAALKGFTVERAKAALAEARQRNADDLAPETYRLAVDEYELAQNVLEVDRSNTEKAQQHAQNSFHHAQRAIEITDIINNFEASDYEYEDIVLWYQEQISRIVAPIEPNVPFYLPNKEVVNGLNNQLQQLVIRQRSLQSSMANVEEQIESRQQATENLKAKLEFIRTLFTPKEAEVYQQGNNVLIRAYGIAFASGSSELTSKNFSLMNKVLEAIKQFPESGIVVSGHTDNVGSDKTNLALSQQRAATVAQFLTEIGQIAPSRVTIVGYGKDRPVASNDTPEGRAANRRVEFLILNE